MTLGPRASRSKGRRRTGEGFDSPRLFVPAVLFEQEKRPMPKLSDGEKEFNWWLWRGIIAFIVLASLSSFAKPPKLPESVKLPHQHSARR